MYVLLVRGLCVYGSFSSRGDENYEKANIIQQSSFEEKLNRVENLCVSRVLYDWHVSSKISHLENPVVFCTSRGIQIVYFETRIYSRFS